jgi:hypothetical protein
MKTLALVNSRGGAAKTASAVHLTLAKNMNPKTLLLLTLIISLVGCAGSKEQKQAYDAAYKFEQDYAMFAGPMALQIIQNYQAVIRLDPNSKIAQKAQQRMDVAQKNWNDYRALQQQSMNAMLPH